jgi:hypothetical protein
MRVPTTATSQHAARIVMQAIASKEDVLAPRSVNIAVLLRKGE